MTIPPPMKSFLTTLMTSKLTVEDLSVSTPEAHP